MPDPSSFWRPEQDAIFRRMWAEGASVTVIGAAVGKTKNAVASRRKTLKLPARGPEGGGRGGANNMHMTPAQRSAASRTAKTVRTARNGGADPAKSLTQNVKSKPPVLPIMPACTPRVCIADLDHRQCRYIAEQPPLITMDTLLYCGAPTDGGAWCPAHRALVYQPPRHRFR